METIDLGKYESRTTYELIELIIKKNEHFGVTSFLVRLYKNNTNTGKSGVKEDPLGAVELINFPVADISTIGTWIDNKYRDGWLVALTSLFKNAKETLYLPVMDFSLPISRESEALLRERMTGVFDLYDNLGRGVLIETNNSYHFMGDTLLTEKQWIVFCANMLLLKHSSETRDIADTRYIGHSLERMYTCIRISEKEGVLPRVLEGIL